MQKEVNEIVAKSLQKAYDHDRTGNVGKAYAYYTVVAELCPARRPEIEEAFVDVLCQWGMQLACQDRFSDVVLCYTRSLDIYPNNPRMLNNFAAHLLRNNDPIKAIEYLKRALRVNPNFLPAERNLQNAFSMAVDRWHFPMLNDKQRNNAFENAIRRRISQGYDTVLDIGTGTGLLSLYAQNAGAKKIYACECSTIMIKIAEKVFETNNAKGIILLPKFSIDLTIPTDITERVKLVVTETFDAGLFGEHVVPSMISVHRNILDRNGTVVPMSATLYVAAVECEYIRYRSSVVFEKVKKFCPLNFDNISVLLDDEYYDTENLKNVKITYITEPRVLFTVNFNDLLDLQQFNVDGVKNMINVKCRHNGTIDGLVTWFKLNLDEEITIDTSERKSCWQTAIFPALPKLFMQGDTIRIKGEILKRKLKCSYSSNDAKFNDYDNRTFLYRVPKEVITFLNDFEYIKLLTEVSKSQVNKEISCILDTSPFPIYGLMLLKENKYSQILYYKTDNTVLRLFIQQIAEQNGFKHKLCIVSKYNHIKVSLDTIFVHDFDIKGEMKDDGQEHNYEFFRCLLKPNGILLPEQIFLIGQLVYSEDLPNMVYVKDENLQGTSVLVFNTSSSEKVYLYERAKPDDYENVQNTFSNMNSYEIAQHINEFKINQIFDLNSSLYLHEPLSDEVIVMEMKESEVAERIVNFGRINAVDNKPLPNTLICWYKIRLTLNLNYDTRRNGSFMNHTAILLEDELKNIILQGNEVCIKVQQAEGVVRIKVK
ncbi:protein arginine N-methyltransferase 9-like isoform X1 [Hylaeus volcanicus]|uniref:protein arginine N-methyltransferase 9-like isoform X1 n=2 Tax=Hylaeus volcanicus TaxID=313075 RepID=UPI0023B7B865|nr:protein arginine N-methyltransferase 9-like isoform X1 [Hylaeus volcanicus]